MQSETLKQKIFRQKHKTVKTIKREILSGIQVYIEPKLKFGSTEVYDRIIRSYNDQSHKYRPNDTEEITLWKQGLSQTEVQFGSTEEH